MLRTIDFLFNLYIKMKIDKISVVVIATVFILLIISLFLSILKIKINKKNNK